MRGEYTFVCVYKSVRVCVFVCLSGSVGVGVCLTDTFMCARVYIQGSIGVSLDTGLSTDPYNRVHVWFDIDVRCAPCAGRLCPGTGSRVPVSAHTRVHPHVRVVECTHGNWLSVSCVRLSVCALWGCVCTCVRVRTCTCSRVSVGATTHKRCKEQRLAPVVNPERFNDDVFFSAVVKDRVRRNAPTGDRGADGPLVLGPGRSPYDRRPPSPSHVNGAVNL